MAATLTKSTSLSSLLVASTVAIVASTSRGSPTEVKHVQWPDQVKDGKEVASTLHEVAPAPLSPTSSTTLPLRKVSERPPTPPPQTPSSLHVDMGSTPPSSPALPQMSSPTELFKLLELATFKAMGRTSEPPPDFLIKTTLPSHAIIHFRPARKDDLDSIAEVMTKSAKVTAINNYMFPKQRQYPGDHVRFTQAYIESMFYNPRMVILITEFAGWTPGVSVENKAKGMKKQIVGMTAVEWGGKVRKDRTDDGKRVKLRVPVSKAQFGAIFHKVVSKQNVALAWELNRSADKSRVKSLDKAEVKQDKEVFDEDAEDHWSVHAIIVLPQLEHQGIGSRLLSLVLEACCEQRQEPVCLTAVPGKEEFYLKRGMTQYGEFEHETGKWVAMFKQAGEKSGGLTVEETVA